MTIKEIRVWYETKGNARNLCETLVTTIWLLKAFHFGGLLLFDNIQNYVILNITCFLFR